MYVLLDDGGWWQEVNPGLPGRHGGGGEERSGVRHQAGDRGRGRQRVADVHDGGGGGGERLCASDDEGLWEAGERLREALDAVEGEIYQVRNRSNQDPLNLPIQVTNLLSMSERGDGRAGSGMVEVFGIMVGRLEGLLAELEGVWGEELVEVTDVLRGLGAEGVVRASSRSAVGR